MKTDKTCPDCGSPLPADAPQGLCPQCLAQAAMKTQSPTVSSPSPDQTITIDPSAVVEVSPTIRYFGDYELIQEIARGGMGIVYKARQKSLNRIVAVKMILAGQLAGEVEVKRFRTEAEAAANLQHPNIVAIHEVGEHEGRHYFSMDYVEGKDLAHLLRGGPLPAADAAEMLKTISDAVQYAHQRGILHRDLKPQNVLLDERGQPRITDFGLAKKVDQDSGLTASGAVMGSPAYMSPEQARGQQDRIGPQCDVYSLGAILYEMLTGQPPFRGETIMATLREVIEFPPVPPSKLNPNASKDLETICLKCLEKQPERRYASARMLSEELDRFLKGEPVQATRAGLARKSWSWLQRNPWALAGGTFMIVLFLIMVSFSLWQQNQYLVWTIKNPGVKVDHSPAIFRWIEDASLLAQTILGICFELFYLSGPILFADFIIRKGRQFSFKPKHLVAYGVAGVLQVVLGLAVVLTLVKSDVWEGHGAGGIMGWIGLLAMSFPFWWFGTSLTWYALQEQRFREFGPSRGLRAEVFGDSKNLTVGTALTFVFRHRYQAIALLYLLLLTWLWGQMHRGSLNSIPFFNMAVAFVLFFWGFTKAYVQSTKAHRNFFLLGSLMMGASLIAFGTISLQQAAIAKGFWPGLLVGVLLCVISAKMNRIPANVNVEEFSSENNGGLRWGRRHPRVLWGMVAALLALSVAGSWALTGGEAFQVFLFAALTPHFACEYARSRSQVREARSVILGFFLVAFLLGTQITPVRVPLSWAAAYLALGLVLVKLQLNWETRHPLQAVPR